MLLEGCVDRQSVTVGHSLKQSRSIRVLVNIQSAEVNACNYSGKLRSTLLCSVPHAFPQKVLNPFCRKLRARLAHAQLETDLVQRNVGHLHALSLANKLGSGAHLRYSACAVKKTRKQKEQRLRERAP